MEREKKRSKGSGNGQITKILEREKKIEKRR